MNRVAVKQRRALLSGDDCACDDSKGIPLRVVEVPELSAAPALRLRFAGLMEGCRYNLNGAADNAVAEALALAVVYPQGSVLAERELVTVSGLGDLVPGTPDGATALACGGMAACQVVRHGALAGQGGAKRLLHTLLVKVYKSLRWLAESGQGAAVGSFAIACWVPGRLSTKAIKSLNRMLHAVGDIDSRFEILLLAPPPSMRRAIFPVGFGSHLLLSLAEAGGDQEAKAKAGLDLLLRSIHAYRAAPEGSLEDGDGDMGFLAAILATEF